MKEPLNPFSLVMYSNRKRGIMDKKPLQSCCSETPCLCPSSKDDDLIDPDKEIEPPKVCFFKRLWCCLFGKKKK